MTFDTHDIPANPENPYPVTYHYDGDGNFMFANDDNSGVTLRVNKAASTFVSLISSNPNNATYGTPPTFTATVAGVPNAKAPTGNVVFTDTYTDKYNNQHQPFVLCTQPLQGQTSQSTATCDPASQTQVLDGGMHSIVVTYIGDGNYNSPPPFPALNQKINPATPAFSNSTKNSVYGTGVTLTATLNGPANVAGPTGTVVFTDTYTDNSNHQMPPTTLCNNVNLTQGTGSSTATCTPAPPALLSGTHVVTATYSDDTNFTSVPSTTIVTQSVAQFMTAGSVSSSSSTSLFGQTVVFTAKVTGAGGSYTAPTGNITFTGAGITGCSNVALDMNTESATCSTNALPPGKQDVVAATYSGDNNYAVVVPTANQTVEYFQLSPSVGFTPLVQSFDNTNTPYTSKTLTITAMPSPTPAYNGNLTMTCAVSQPGNDNNGPMPTCSVANTMIPGASGPTDIVFTTSSTTPIGNYTVTITGQDVADGATPNTTKIAVNVGQLTGSLLVPGNIQVAFVGTSDMSVNFACAQIIGPNGTVLYIPNQTNIYNITCGVSPGTTTVSTDPNNPTQVTVTITSTSTQQAELRIIQGIFGMGMPAIVLLGSLRFRKLSRTRILQILGLMLVFFALFQAVGCGGGFTPPPAGSTPPGSYKMVVVGTTSDGVQTLAVVPFVVNGS